MSSAKKRKNNNSSDQKSKKSTESSPMSSINYQKDLIKKEYPLVNDFLSFMTASCSQFHAVEESSRRLKEAGFVQISEKNDKHFASLKPGGKYFFTRNQSTLFAFVVGGKYKAGNGFTISGAHTDSPVLKVKPVSKVTNHGYVSLGVECYGGGLWHTWFDRELSVAGRVFVSTGEDQFESKLVRINRPILRIPNLAIHLNREVNEKGFLFNTQTNLLPFLATVVKQELEAKLVSEGKSESSEEKQEKKTDENKKDDDYFLNDHPSLLMDLIATELKIKPNQISNFELCLYDTQPPTLSGVYNEFIIARGLDNLMMSFVCLRALIDSSDSKSIEDEEQIRCVGLFDNEEVGSNSMMGAASNMMTRVLQRIVGDGNKYDAAISKSLLLSCDMAHGLHPNYSDKHEEKHRPQLHKGLVVKQNSNQKYATSGVTQFMITEIAKRNKIPLQKFVVRNDSLCGSTIGPILASNTGIRTVDVGIPQLAMHSIREMAGTADLQSAYELVKAIYSDFPALDRKTTVDK